MSVNVYELWNAIGNVDEKFIYEVKKYSEIQKRKQKMSNIGFSVVAGIILCILSFNIINNKISSNIDTKENQMTQTNKLDNNISGKEDKNSIDKQNLASPNPYGQSSQYQEVKINKDVTYFNSKYGGRIKQVTREVWRKKYNNNIFKCDSNTKYFLSYSKKSKVLYGQIKIKTQNNRIVAILVGKNVMIDSGYEQLDKTKINGKDIAICSIENTTNSDNHQYGAVYSKNHIAYTIEWNEGNLEKFISVLKEIIKE